MIAQAFNMVNGNTLCLSSDKTSPVHGRPMSESYIEYDYRLKTGKFPILERLGEAMINSK